MKGKKISVLLASSIIILLCVTMLVAGTYALWSDSVSVDNHLTAGSLKVKLERTNLNKTLLDNQTGYLVTSTVDTVVDFTDSNTQDDNVFDVSEGEKVVPGTSYEATMKIKNNGDVAFEYDVIIKLTSVNNALANQLKVYIDGVDKGYLSEFVQNGQAVIDSQTMAKNDNAKVFVVKVVFEHLATNNEAQNQEVKFDLLVNAVQVTQ